MSNGSLTLALDTDFDGCMRVVQQITEDKQLYLANSMNSLRIEDKRPLASKLSNNLIGKFPTGFSSQVAILVMSLRSTKDLEEIQA